MARSGERVELQPRPVTVHRIAVRWYEYPQLVLEVDCGGGTYIRSLGRDLAESLGTRAVMSALVRTAIGNFSLDAAQDPGKLTKENIAGRLLPMISAVDYLPRLELLAEEINRVHRGQTIAKRIAGADAADTAAVDMEGNLVAILSSSGAELLRPARNFLCGIG
jgi:tRNA pseudouridine55 synthase